MLSAVRCSHRCAVCPGDGCVQGLLRQAALSGPHVREGGEASGAGDERGGRGL